MKNITVSLDERIAAEVRVKAAIEGKSVSTFISDLLEREVGRRGTSRLDAIEEFLAGRSGL